MNIKTNLDLLKALSEESRYKIVEILLNGEKCACELPKLINKTQSNTSMHLAKLIDYKILKSRRDGKKIIYSINDLRVYNIFKALGYLKIKKIKLCDCVEKKTKNKILHKRGSTKE